MHCSPNIPQVPADAEAELHRHHVIHTTQVIIGSCLAVAALAYLLHPVRLLHTLQGSQRLAQAEALERQSFTGTQPELRIHHYCFENAGNPELPQVGWIPIALLDGSGRITIRQLDVPADVSCISQEIWFDPATHCYRRAYVAGEHTLFATAFDGQYLYTFDPAQGHGIKKEPIGEAFSFPEQPGDLLGLTAGLPVSLHALPERAQPEYRGEAALATEGHGERFQLAGTGAGRNKDCTWQVMLEKRTGTLAEVACLEGGKPLLTICRGRIDRKRRPPERWDLSDIAPIRKTGPDGLTR